MEVSTSKIKRTKCRQSPELSIDLGKSEFLNENFANRGLVKAYNLDDPAMMSIYLVNLININPN